MNKIELQNTLPQVFTDLPHLNSQVWKQTVVFEKGKYYLIEANSGTGKSSLCSYIYGQRTDYVGNIFFDDQNINRLSSTQWDKTRCVKLSFLFQELRLFPELTAKENVILNNNLTNYKTEQQIIDMFEYLNIVDKLDVEISKLSWGQQQRVAIIRSLCQPFDFLILDEPISHLDDANAQIIASLIESEASRQGASVIATSIGKHLPLNYHNTFSL